MKSSGKKSESKNKGSRGSRSRGQRQASSVVEPATGQKRKSTALSADVSKIVSGVEELWGSSPKSGSGKSATWSGWGSPHESKAIAVADKLLSLGFVAKEPAGEYSHPDGHSARIVCGAPIRVEGSFKKRKLSSVSIRFGRRQLTS